VTQAFGLKGAAALRGRPPGPRSCTCTTLGGLEHTSRQEPAARTGARTPTLPFSAAVARESSSGRPAGRRCPRLPSLSFLLSLSPRVALASRRRQGLAARCGRRSSEPRRPPQAGAAQGETRHDGADMAPLKPRSRAPRAGRALSKPGEVTWLHTFDCSRSPSPEGGPGQVRSHVRVTGLRGLSPGASRGWGARARRGGGVEQPARGRRREAS
jgi:hypothetical protein